MMSYRLLGIFVKQTHRISVQPVTGYSTSSPSHENAYQEVKTLLDELEDITMIPLKLTACMFGKRFSSSHIQYSEFNTDLGTGEKMVPEVSFKSLFRTGFEQLHRLTDGDISLPMTKDILNFINGSQPLQSFLENIEMHESALKRNHTQAEVTDILTKSNESGVAALLTHHLLSPLIPGNKYIMSNDYGDKQQFCPCYNSDCKREIKYGRTGIGNKKMWYGIPDVVLLLNSVMIKPITKKKSRKKYKLNQDEKMSEICEVKNNARSLVADDVTSQIISQAVIFSLYISKLRLKNPQLKIPDISLIPSLIINPCSLYVYMYDHKNDVLLRNDGLPLQLWDKSGFKFKKSTIFYVWMILNHMICMPQFSSAQLKIFQNSSNLRYLCAANDLEPEEISSGICFQNTFAQFGPHENFDKKLKRFRVED